MARAAPRHDGKVIPAGYGAGRLGVRSLAPTVAPSSARLRRPAGSPVRRAQQDIGQIAAVGFDDGCACLPPSPTGALASDPDSGQPGIDRLDREGVTSLGRQSEALHGDTVDECEQLGGQGACVRPQGHLRSPFEGL